MLVYLFSNRTLVLILKVESEEKGRPSTVIFLNEKTIISVRETKVVDHWQWGEFNDLRSERKPDIL